MEKKDFCGSCCWMMYEDADGYGQCAYRGLEIVHCSDPCTADRFVSVEQKRKYVATLLRLNRYRRDQNVPSIYRMPDPKEIGKAVDFAIQYIKTI